MSDNIWISQVGPFLRLADGRVIGFRHIQAIEPKKDGTSVIHVGPNAIPISADEATSIGAFLFPPGPPPGIPAAPQEPVATAPAVPLSPAHPAAPAPTAPATQ